MKELQAKKYVHQIVAETSANLKLAILSKQFTKSMKDSKEKQAKIKLFIEITDIFANLSEFTFISLIYLIDIMR